jgi:multiple sugar transport system ATP-binding protein
MVFQNYALYPHMSVAQNLAFGLKLRKLDKAEVRRRVQVAATTLGLEDYLERKPGALSGGQRQRVAMGRAIVREPQAFLMDEPLSNLDAQLRVQMRAEIQKLQRTLGVTTIYVTHDQTEAMTMGDRIAVMRGGTLQQVDVPEHVYRWPVNRFVAGFIGSPAMNMVNARLTRSTSGLIATFGSHSLAIGDEVLSARPALRAHEGGEVVLGIRPEDIEDAAFTAEAPDRTLTVICTLREALGSEVLVHFGAVDDGSSAFIARVDQLTSARMGDPVQLVVDTSRLHFFEPSSGVAIYSDDGPPKASVAPSS